MRKPGITRNQLDLLERRAAGYQTRQIAAELGIAEATASHSLGLAAKRLGVANTTAAVAFAIGEGLIDYQRVTKHRRYLESRSA